MRQYTTGELTRIRNRINTVLPDTATIKRITRTSDSMGGSREAEVDQEDVSVLVAPAGTSGQEAIIAEGIQNETTWKLLVPAETDVLEDDILAVGSREFQVKAILTPRSYEVLKRVICVERV